MDALTNVTNWSRRSRRGVPHDLDCFYHGRVAGMADSNVAVSACEFPDALHVAVFMAGHSSFEITPVEDGGHVGFKLSDLDESLNGTCGNSGIDLAAGPGDHGHNGSEARHPAEHLSSLQAWMHTGKPRQRRTCTKTVEVLVVNDFSPILAEREHDRVLLARGVQRNGGPVRGWRVRVLDSAPPRWPAYVSPRHSIYHSSARLWPALVLC